MKRLLLLLLLTVALVATACGSETGGGATVPDDATPLATTTSTTVAPTTTTVLTLMETADATITGGSLPRFGDAPDPAVGLVAPTVAGVSFDGSPVVIEPSDNYTVLMFLAHWCSHCQTEVEELGPYYSDIPLPENVDVLVVSTGVDETRPNYPPSEWLTPAAWPTPVMIDTTDGAVSSAFGLNAFPFWTILDPDGVVLARTAGSLPLETVEGLFANLAALTP